MTAFFIALLLASPAAPAAGEAPSFLPASTCALCHSRIERPGTTETIGQYPLWNGSMMAHASRDPYWKAKVRQEVALTPAAARVIEDKCLRCHAPTEQYAYRGKPQGMALASLARDSQGVTCTVCHQIVPDGLGTRASFTGGFRIGAKAQIFGPHQDPFLMPMVHHTDAVATYSRHILDSALCGSCHTVITPTLAPDGRVLGDFIEQAPFLEWLASDFANAASCQSCHVPVLDDGKGSPIRQHIAHRPPGGPFPPTQPRTPFGLHFFAGANAAMLDHLAGAIPDEAAALQRTAARSRQMLGSALELSVRPQLSGDLLRTEVEVRNLTGHKLPTGFPSRRLWLEFRVLDAGGATLFHSGAWDEATGELRVNTPQPHYGAIHRSEQTMIYEAAYLDPQGRPTLSLLRAATYGKDNRILPRGFNPSRALPGGLSARQVGPAGTAADPGFGPGAHRVRYEYRRGPGAAPARVQVTAWYQSIAPAHAASLRGDHPDIRAFRAAGSRLSRPVAAARREAPVSPISDK